MSDKKENEVDQGSSDNKKTLIIFLSALVILFSLFLIFRSTKQDKSLESTEKETETVDDKDKVEEADKPDRNLNLREEDDDDDEVSFTVNEEDEDMNEEAVIEEEEEEEVETYPDLYISDYEFDDDPRENEEFTISIEIGNDGDADAEDVEWEWWPIEGSLECEGAIEEIAAGETETVECEYTYGTEDTFEMTFIVDPDGDIEESDEDNNVLEDEVTTLPEEKADLVISEYSFDPVPEKGVPFTVRIGIKNEGNVAAEDFWWEWWPTWANYFCREQISTLAPNSEKVVYCEDYTYGGWAKYDTKAVADADDDVEESDETNNEYHEPVIPIHVP